MKYSTFFLFLLFGFALTAQSDFRRSNFTDGTITLRDGRQQSGQLHYRLTDRIADTVYFRLRKTDEFTAYTAADLQAYTAAGDSYAAARTVSDFSPSAQGFLETTPELNLQKDTLFLLKLTTGRRELYYHKNEAGKVNFFIKNNENFDLLTYKQYRTADGKVREAGDFRAQLQTYLADCTDLDFSVLDYRRELLKELFATYYVCTNDDTATVKSSQVTTFVWSVVGGIAVTTLKYNAPPELSYLEPEFYDPAYDPYAGFGIDVIFPGKRRRWAAHGEVAYTSVSLTGRQNFTDSTMVSVTRETDFGYKYVQITCMARHTFTENQRGFFFNAGGMIRPVIDKNNLLRESRNLGGSEAITERPIFPTSRDIDTSLTAGVGFLGKKFVIELRGERAIGPRSFIFVGGVMPRLTLLAGYRLGAVD